MSTVIRPRPASTDRHRGTDFGDIDALAGRIATALGVTPEEARRSPHALCGTVDEIAADLEERRETLGISNIGISASSLDDLSPVIDRLAGT